MQDRQSPGRGRHPIVCDTIRLRPARASRRVRAAISLTMRCHNRPHLALTRPPLPEGEGGGDRFRMTCRIFPRLRCVLDLLMERVIIIGSGCAGLTAAIYAA